MNLANAKVKNYISRFGNSPMAKQCSLPNINVYYQIEFVTQWLSRLASKRNAVHL